MTSRARTPDMEAAKPLIEKVSPFPVPPFLLDDSIHRSLAEGLPVDSTTAQPLPSWTFAKKRPSGERLPQTIAHRGYKADSPENTMGAFKGAVQVGANAIETDVHLTKDDVVVLSHDATLKRCFGRDEKIVDCEWDDIKRQTTLKAPHETMPRLKDLLAYLASPGQEQIWLLLDIKLDNNPDAVIRLIASAIASVAPPSSVPWNRRIVLGCWAAKYLPLCAHYLPTYPITHIGFSIPYARQFFNTSNISFNILQKSLLAPAVGRRFLRDAKKKGRPVYDWTVNDDSMMKWSIEQGIDGVITDDPKRFLEVCEEWEQGKRDIKITFKEWLMVAWINLMVIVFGCIFWWKYGRATKAEGEEVKSRKSKKSLPVTPVEGMKQ